MSDTEVFLRTMFGKIVQTAFEQGKLTEQTKDSFLNRQPQDLDELDECNKELLEMLENHEKYKLIARIEKADEVIEHETDQGKKQMYVAARAKLIRRLEEIA